MKRIEVSEKRREIEEKRREVSEKYLRSLRREVSLLKKRKEMGSAASIKLNDELQSLYNDIHEINKLLIINDLKILKEQQSFTFKKHKDIIIKILTMRGKDYLYQLTKEFDRIEYNKLLGDNQYCNFLYLLSKSSYEIDLLVIEIAVNGVGISELTICNILSVMNKYELKDLCNGYYEKNNRNLIDVIKGKVNKDSVIATFFDLILKLIVNKLF